MDREELKPADIEVGELELAKLDFAAAEALITLEALLLLPEHHQQIATQGVAGRVLDGLTVFRVARVTHYLRLALVQPAVVGTKVHLYVRIWKGCVCYFKSKTYVWTYIEIILV